MPDLSALIDEIAVRVVLAQPQDRDEIGAVVQLVDTVEKLAIDARDGGLVELARACRESLSAASPDAPEGDGVRALESAAKIVERMQSHTSMSETEGDHVGQDEKSIGEIVLPAWVDERTFADFLAALADANDEIESSILQLEKGQEETLIALRRRVHTAKGEAGAVGQEAIERVFHAMEDVLEVLPPVPSSRQVDYLLALKDWLGSALDRLRERKAPRESAEDVLARVGWLLEPNGQQLRVESMRPIARAHTDARWMTQFLNDATADVVQAQEILRGLDHGSDDAGMLERLARMFGKHKEVAGYLDLKDIAQLAQAMEGIFDFVQARHLRFDGQYVEVASTGFDWMKQLLDLVRGCVDGGRAVERIAEMGPFLSRIDKLVRMDARIEVDVPKLQLFDLGSPAEDVATNGIDAASDDEVLCAPVRGNGNDVRDGVRGAAAHDVVAIRETIKVDVACVDNIVELIGELMIIESMVLNAPELEAVTSPHFRKQVNQLTKISRDLQMNGMQLRMVPVRGIFQKMARVVRDSSRKSGKDVRLQISGEGTEMDRCMVDQLADPLIHLIRNSVDHGIETPSDRIARGKPAHGTIYLDAHHEGGSIAIEMRDDGGGLDREAIRARALQQGLIKDSDELGDGDLHRLIFLPGFSTAKQVSELSGRGVGLDVVKKNVESMRGRVLVESTWEQGTAFKLILPLTLAIIDGMLIRCGSEKYIIPTLSIVESIKPSADMVKTVGGRHEIIGIRSETIVLSRLGRLLRIPEAGEDPTEGIVVVIESFGRKVALLVDEVMMQQQVVIKGLGGHFETTNYFSGATILADGRVSMILNVHELCSLGERPDKGEGARAIQRNATLGSD